MKLLNILFFLLFLFNVNNAIQNFTDIPIVTMYPNDQICLNRILTLLQLAQPFNELEYCQYFDFFQCDSNGYLISFNLTSNGVSFNASGSYNYTTLRCFDHKPYPNMKLTRFSIDQTFYTTTPLTLSEVVLDDCNLIALPLVTSLNNSLIIYPGPTYVSIISIDLFSYVGLKKFEVSNYYNLPSSKYMVTVSNGQTVLQSSPMESVKLHLNKFPEISNIKIKRLELICDSFNSDYMTPFDTYTNINEFSLSANDTSIEYSFPTNFFTSIKSNIKKLEFNFKFKYENSFYNFSNFTSIESISINNPVNINYVDLDSSINFRITSLGSAKSLILNQISAPNTTNFLPLFNNLSSISITNSNITLGVNTFFRLPNLKNLTLSNNLNVYDVLNEVDVCKLNNVKINGLSLGGSLPGCIACYLNQSNIDFRNNNFINYNSSNNYKIPICSSIIPNIKKVNGKTYIYGTSLGFSNDSFYSIPSYAFNVDIPNFSFYTNQTLSGIIQLNFSVPNQSFTLNADYASPTVNSVTISNDGLGILTFGDSNFTYNTSAINIFIGSNRCLVNSSTYYKIVCTLENYNRYDVNVLSTISIYGSSISNIPITMTPGLVNRYLTCSQECSQPYNGICDRNTGTCICACNGNGVCNYTTSQCECSTLWTGPNCIIPKTSVNSISQLNYNASYLQLVINGFFGEVHDGLSVTVGGLPCSPILTNSGYIYCILPFNPTPSLQIVITQNTYTYTYPYGFTFIKNECLNNCTDEIHGTCNYANGVCTCNAGYDSQDGDCRYTLPVVSGVYPSSQVGGQVTITGKFGNDFGGPGNSLKIMIGNTECTNATGSSSYLTCIAPPGAGTFNLNVTINGYSWFGTNYYTYLFNCLNVDNCSKNGNCINMNICKCFKDYYGSKCDIKQHYVSSVIPTTINGGQVTIYGDFGNAHLNLQILIGEESCVYTNSSVSSSTIICEIGPGNGTKSLTITQNDLTWTSKNYYVYIEITKTCPNNCFESQGQGQCDKTTGQCKCTENKWMGFDCSSPIIIQDNNSPDNSEPLPISTSSINTETGVTQIKNQGTLFKISIIKIIELDIINQNPVKEFTLKQIWDSFEQSQTDDGNDLYIFNQTLNNNNNGSSEANNGTIIYKIEEIKNSKTFEFADLQLNLDSNSIKITIEINNYPFESVLNILQLQMISSVENSNDGSENQCNDINGDIKSNNINDQSSSYVKVEKNNKILYGRFLNKILSDGRPTFISNTILNNTDSIIIGLNIPHFKNNSIIDPDFSVLLSSSFKNSCDGPGGNNKTVIIAVSVVIPVVVVGALVVAASIFYRKNRIEIKLKTMKLRRF